MTFCLLYRCSQFLREACNAAFRYPLNQYIAFVLWLRNLNVAPKLTNIEIAGASVVIISQQQSTAYSLPIPPKSISKIPRHCHLLWYKFNAVPTNKSQHFMHGFFNQVHYPSIKFPMQRLNTICPDVMSNKPSLLFSKHVFAKSVIERFGIDRID